MKKVLFIIATIFCFSISSLHAATCMRNSFESEDGDKMVLSENCTFSITSIDGEYYSGTYEYEPFATGEQKTIYFYFSDGSTHTGTIGKPVYGDITIFFDGLTFTRVKQGRNLIF